ncbi:synaptic vesicle 2-related protein-like [Chanos chanos]|uniref:Synaptic vesicle 2-related protein-like n=1 Tax=Chanos chanos TaxID=29144 RepID=A0A6J2WGB1_CHACN|nr:synaptic vesicle 2-related protein-like [Chanos chanos]
MSTQRRSVLKGFQPWRDVSTVTFDGVSDREAVISEEQCGDEELYVHGVWTVLDQVELGDNGTGPQSAQESRTETFTVEDAVEAAGFGRFQWKLSMLTGLAWMADAMEMMILSVLAPQLRCEWRLPSWEVALITSIVFVGMMISSSLWGNISDKYGRRVGLSLCMTWTLYYGLLSAFAPVYGWILVLRGLVGFGIGGAPQSVTLYSEFLPAKSRATCIMLIEVFWALGTVLEVLLAMLIMPTLGWRWLLGLSTLPLIIFVASSCWLPESARFDVLTGNQEKAMRTLNRIAKDNGRILPQGRLVMASQEERGKVRDLFIPEYYRTTILLWLIWFCNAFLYYGLVLLTTELFQVDDVCHVSKDVKTEPRCRLGCKTLTMDDYKDLLWTTLAEFTGLFVVLWVVDRLGRRKSIVLCFFIFALCILPLYACTGRTVLIVFIFLARAAITAGWQVVFVYTPEVYPTATRAIGIGTSSGMARVGALLTPFIAQVLLETSVYLTLSVYFLCSILGMAATCALPIETAGRALQESTRITRGPEARHQSS